jgi:hypothetical protein
MAPHLELRSDISRGVSIGFSYLKWKRMLFLWL